MSRESVHMEGDVIVAMDKGTGRDYSCEVRAIKHAGGVLEIIQVDYFLGNERIVNTNPVKTE